MSKPLFTANRRQMMAGGMSAAFIAGCSPRSTWSVTETDVLVIGGGMAGISAALRLEAEGVNVQLIEADKQLGGRCFTLRTSDGDFDCGATTVGPNYGNVLTYAYEADVPFIAPPGKEKFSYHINGQFVHPNAWETSSANLLVGAERGILPEQLEFPILMKSNKIKDVTQWNSEELLAYDVALDRYLKDNGASDEALRLIDLTSNTMGLDQTSALFQMREFAGIDTTPKAGEGSDKVREVYDASGGPAGFYNVKGGMLTLIERVATLLKTEPMLGDPVVAIDVEKDGASVTMASGKKMRAKSVICTVPYSVLRSIAITPEPTGPKKAAIDNALYTLTTHVFFIPTKPYWEDDGHPAGLVSDDVVERVMANHDEDGKVSWLDVWMNGDAAAKLDAMPEKDMMTFVQDRLEAMRPSMKGAIAPVGAYSWGQNEFVKGNKYIMRPGDARGMYPWLAEPYMDRLRFAGEHTRDFEAGLEAAASSGMREAGAYLELFA